MQIPPRVSSKEQIGHSIRKPYVDCRERQERIVNGEVWSHVKDRREISVDRISAACSLDKMDDVTEGAIDRAKRSGRTFHGWAIFDTRQIRGLGCCVKSKPNNLLSADILLPDDAPDCRREKKQYVKGLMAAFLCWMPPPVPQT